MLFDSFDPDGSGQLEFGELNKAFRRGATMQLSAELQDGAMGAIETKAQNKSTKMRVAAHATSFAVKMKKKLSDRQSVTDQTQQELREKLMKNALKLGDMFKKWDEDGSGTINRKEWHKALPLIGISTTKDQIDKLFDYLDDDGSGEISYTELRAKLKQKSGGSSPSPKTRRPPQGGGTPARAEPPAQPSDAQGPAG